MFKRKLLIALSLLCLIGCGSNKKSSSNENKEEENSSETTDDDENNYGLVDGGIYEGK